MVDGQLLHDETLGNEQQNVHPFPEAAENANNGD